jgi:hypothetical protein
MRVENGCTPAEAENALQMLLRLEMRRHEHISPTTSDKPISTPQRTAVTWISW